ncbi:MAG: hypothetical protein IE931_11270 [Sphingobacteriales bacterium]|nr:hypothetical protein [Sphingobacteriales bacterium]
MKAKIENIDQLRAEIRTLKIKCAEDEIYFNQGFLKFKKIIEAPTKFFNSILNLFGLADEDENNKHSDWVTSLGRIALPFLLNTTLLRGRGFITKAIVSLLSQRTVNAKNFNKDVLTSWVDTLTNWINNSTKKSKKKIDYGIPPDSETY